MNMINKNSSLIRGLKSFLQGFCIGVPICLTITDNFCTICQVEGISMQPVLNNDRKKRDYVVISRWKAKQFSKIERGDIVSIISPKDPNTLFIKRIIGLEGDTIRTLNFKEPVVKIPKGHCWIEGDNHKHSLDSNTLGPVPLGLVNGVATRIIWPPSRWCQLINQVPCNRKAIGKNHTLGYKDDGHEMTGIEHDIDTIDSDHTTTSRDKMNMLNHLPQNTLRHASDMNQGNI